MGRVFSTNGGEEMHTGFWWRKVREREHLEDSDLDERVLIKWVLMKAVGKTGNGLIWLRIRKIGEFCACGN